MLSDALTVLARRHGVATTYQDQLERTVEVSEQTVVSVLASLGVDAAATDAAEADVVGPSPVVVTRQGSGRTRVAVGDADAATLLLEGGGETAVDVAAGEASLPADLPLGWHELRLTCGGENTARVPICIAPRRLAEPPRGWGWMTQLYAMRSADSWGVGDLSDLTTLARWTAEQGGDVVLVNPLHAVAPVEPMQPSPYYPASRRWLNPIYLRIEELPEYAAAEPTRRRHVDALRPANDGERIDRDAVWTAKQAALRLLFDPADVEPPSGDLRDFATWAALVERHGADWRQWSEELRRPEAPAVERARTELADRVLWHAWLQRRTEDQCRAAHAAATEAGMAIGVMHDLAVGTDAGGADAWALQDALALDMHIGAPPDEFNQQGQDWGMPPWRPAELARRAYAPLREMVRAQLRRGSGLRVDHVLGLFRMWWIPAGASPGEGTYVSYDAEAMLSVIALEAHRAGAVVVGEDLGTVPPDVRRVLVDIGVLGTSLLLFEREEATEGRPGRLLPLDRWRREAMASVTTHDLPTVRGWLRGEHVRLRGDLGLLRDVDEEWRTWRRERAEIVAGLESVGLVAPDADEAALARAMHSAIALTPSRLVFAAPGDAVGDLRQPNLPGTTDEYPNWRLPVSDDTGRLLLLDDLLADPRTTALVTDLRLRLAEAGR